MDLARASMILAWLWNFDLRARAGGDDFSIFDDDWRNRGRRLAGAVDQRAVDYAKLSLRTAGNSWRVRRGRTYRPRRRGATKVPSADS